MTTYRALLAALLLSPSLLLAASLNQSAWVPNTSNYEYGHNSIPNMQITGAPADADWSRWAMLHDKSAYRLYAFKKVAKIRFINLPLILIPKPMSMAMTPFQS